MTYQLRPDGLVVRLADGAFIPEDPRNADRQRFEAWVAEGNVPSAPPAVPVNPIALVNARVEEVARSMGYSSAASCAGYVTSTVPQWAAEARAFVAWRDAVWLAVFERKDEEPPTTTEAVLALLPAWVPPTST